MQHTSTAINAWAEWVLQKKKKKNTDVTSMKQSGFLQAYWYIVFKGNLLDQKNSKKEQTELFYTVGLLSGPFLYLRDVYFIDVDLWL